MATLPNSISITDSILLRMLKGLNKCGRPLGHCTNNKFCFPRKKAHLSVNNHLLKKNTSSSLGNRKMVLSLIESLLSYMSKIIKEHYFFGSYCLGLWIDFETKTEDGEKKKILIYKRWEVEADLLQWNPASLSFWQIPLHLDGIGPIPSSLKLADSGQTPTRISIKQKGQTEER